MRLIGAGGGRDEVWDRETMFLQLAKRSPHVVVSGKLQYFSHSKYFRLFRSKKRPAEDIRNA